MDTQITLRDFDKTKRDWHIYNLAKTREKRLFYKLLTELCSIVPEPNHLNGRPPVPIRDLVFSACLKLYSNYSGRKVMSDLVHAQGASYIEKAPHYNTLSDFLMCPATHDLLQRLLTISALPLKHLEDSFSIDSSGFGSYQYERWVRVRFKRGGERGFRNYLKGHIMIGTRTNVICGCEITLGNASDIKQAPALINHVGNNFNIKEVSCDKGYSSMRIHQLIESLGAIPFIPFQDRHNPQEGKAPEIWIRMYRYFNNHKEEFLKHYHKRSNVETTFAMIKTRLGEFLKSKTFESQRNELLIKFICHNICCLVSEMFENNIHANFAQCLKELVDRKPKEEAKIDLSQKAQKQDL